MGQVHGILFDFDGTLTRPDGIDFAVLRRVTGCPDGEPILKFIAALEDAAAQADAHRRLHEAELEAARRSLPNAGAEELLRWCQARDLRLGLLTRNTREAVEVALGNFNGVSAVSFQAIISRDEPIAPKPSPEGVCLAAERMGLTPGELLMVGDFWFDVEAGSRAGSPTAYLTNGSSTGDPRCTPTYVVHGLAELKNLPLFANGKRQS